MSAPCVTEFTVEGDVAIFRMVGSDTLQHGIRAIGAAIARANGLRMRKLLVAVGAVEGWEVPTLAMRVAMIRDWSAAAGGVVAIAMVCRPEFIDPQKFGIAVAAGFGIVADVFEREDEAMAWLRSLA